MAERRQVVIGEGADQGRLTLGDAYGTASLHSRAGGLDGLHVALELPGLQADARIWLTPMDEALAPFFDGLARDWRGWQGTKEWKAYEGGLSPSCRHDGLGHVSLEVALGNGMGWEVRGSVALEAGGLDLIARNVERFEPAAS